MTTTHPVQPDSATAASPVVLRLDHVSKVFCESFELARTYAIRDIFGGRPGGAGQLRPGEWLAVRDVSFAVRRGERLLVLGTRGSGKTAIAKLISGVLKPDRGRVELAGRAALVGSSKLGMNPFMTAREYLQLALALRGATPAQADDLCRDVLELSGLSESRDVRVIDLSGQALKYLSLAASLVVPRDISVFDGLGSGGDDPVGQRLDARIEKILTQGTAVVLTSSARRTPASIQRAVILHDGEILYEGLPDAALLIYEKFLRILRKADWATAWSGRRRSTAQAGPNPSDRPDGVTRVELVRRLARRMDDALYVPMMEDELTRTWGDGRPVIVGPYFSDLGFELLYWIPFLAWMRERFGGAGQTVVAVSRGRIGDWYAGVASQYVDVFDLVTTKQFRERYKQRAVELGSFKQGVESGFEQELVDAVAQRLGLRDPGVVHPSLLVHLCARVSRGRLPLAVVGERARYRILTRPSGRPPLPGLPSDYIAASFWFSTGFRDTPAHRAVVATLLREASRRAPVVLLDTKEIAAEERTACDGGTGITVFDTYPYGEERIPTQARVIAGARAYLGTFGGRSWMAPFLGVAALSIYGEAAGHLRLHTAVAEQAFAHLAGAVDVVCRSDGIDPGTAAALLDRLLTSGRPASVRDPA